MLLLSIWDPYYCAGKVKVHLMNLGFTNVVNENQDFYAVANTPRQPEFDVLLTSPPYSDGRSDKKLRFKKQSTSAEIFFLRQREFFIRLLRQQRDLVELYSKHL